MEYNKEAFARFLQRCPELKDVLGRRIGKIDERTLKELIAPLAELFLNPVYTIPVMGCFPKFAKNIVEEAVSLLSACNLVSNCSEESECMIEDGAFNLIEHHTKSGNGIYLHELACLAFCRALELNDSLFGVVATYFNFAPPPFKRFLFNGTNLESKNINRYIFSARISYRLLLLRTDYFADLGNWSCFLELADKMPCISFDAANSKDVNDLRWCTLQILCVIVRVSDAAVLKSGLGAEEAAESLLRWEEFCEDVSIEKISPFIEPFVQAEGYCTEQNKIIGGHTDIPSLRPCSTWKSERDEIEPPTKIRKSTSSAQADGDSFVMTSNVKNSFQLILLSVERKWPVLLCGPAGAGKSVLLKRMAYDAGRQVLSLQMDEQVDGKTLIGSYVCCEQPGEFRWQPGSLTQAAINGYWVVLEDIDKASPDVHSILLPLLEGVNSFGTSPGEELKVSDNFRVFSTISKFDGITVPQVNNFLSNLWRRVSISSPSFDDVRLIVNSCYPDLRDLVDNMIETISKVNEILRHPQLANSSTSFFHHRFSLRDLLKWCKRITGQELLGQGLRSNLNMLSDYQCYSILIEALDIFAFSTSSTTSQHAITQEIANLWRVPCTKVEDLIAYRPDAEFSDSLLRIGRITLQVITSPVIRGNEQTWNGLVKMCCSMRILERIACCVKYNEPVLLVGETGTGKTTLVQNLASLIGQKITVLNLSQQSDVADLLGGYKPMDAKSICIPLYKDFEKLFSLTFSVEDNAGVFASLQNQLKSKSWKKMLIGFKKYVDSYRKLARSKSGAEKKRKKPKYSEEIMNLWENFALKVESADAQIRSNSGMLFSFVEGAFVTALKNGDWILLDEVNLAPPETLQRLIGVLEGEFGSLCLSERGDIGHIPRHPKFRIFACMNPANDAGKKDLPYTLRSRFTEFYVDDIFPRDDLKLFVNKFMEESVSDSRLEKRIIDFYEEVRLCSEERLQDGANQKPQYSLRSLYRALEYTRKAKARFGFLKALHDGFCMFFLSLLDAPSACVVRKMINDNLLNGCGEPPPCSFDAYINIKDDTDEGFLKTYVLTDSVKRQLVNLARAVFIKKYPVLLQGPTSSGKTSLVQYLAAKSGHKFIRINNHEHTDLQEYLGSYVCDASGKLVFYEGALVRAVRNGYWIVLDELNLAPSDVLEALNRLLDDNRELYVPELQETIRPHPDFMLFATQNPPTVYGGRKILSRAFRNRFVEVHVDDIPDEELLTIIVNRCSIPLSRAKLMITVMKDLQQHRQNSKIFAGKHGFITPRDLFRWSTRLRNYGDSKEVMAEHGYYLLADRLRDEGEKRVVRDVLERHLRVKIVEDDLYKFSLGEVENSLQCFNVIMTKSMRRLFFLLKRSYECNEPILLVGDTGGGKTTVCQLLSKYLGLKLFMLNCHQYTETSDFIGGFYPVRERSQLSSEYTNIVDKFIHSEGYKHFPIVEEISSDIDAASSTIDFLSSVISDYENGIVAHSDHNPKDIEDLKKLVTELKERYQRWKSIFTWQDGPLVQAMKLGDLILVDEISLADDSVLERLNSVLEPERKLSLAEKGGNALEEITAKENFLVLATMNPGGDFGKKELSPALRNRFTEIWVPAVADVDELNDIVSKRFFSQNNQTLVSGMLHFWEWFNHLQIGRTLTVRDILSWAAFVNETAECLKLEHAVIHGVFLVVLDGLSLGTGMLRKEADILREKCLHFLLNEFKQLNLLEDRDIANIVYNDWSGGLGDQTFSAMVCPEKSFGIHPFYVKKGLENLGSGRFEFKAPTTRRNAFRVLRALQLSKPVLLEGSPGVGKTSLIMALGNCSGHKVVRINLSEQTDLMDLLGSDLPVENDTGMSFAWADGVLLKAMKDGCWVLLDELNLAPQSVLEGLNSILDHRAEVFIPELGASFKCPPTFRVFACQNPTCQGGGRKGLPRSFLNRFTKVYVDELDEDDYLYICSSQHPSVPRSDLSKLVSFNRRLQEMMFDSQWEFNLRDVLRSCQIMEGKHTNDFLNVVYLQRMRTSDERMSVLRLYEETFGYKPPISPYPRVQVNKESIIVGRAKVKRSCIRSLIPSSQINVTPSIRHTLESVCHCVENNWLSILVGPASSGKTSLVRLLAQLTGNVLHELNLSSSTEISELLGSFEQYDAFRRYKYVVSQVDVYMKDCCRMHLESSFDLPASPQLGFPGKLKELYSKWFFFKSGDDHGPFLTCQEFSDRKLISSALDFLVDMIERLQILLSDSCMHFSCSWSANDLNKTLKVVKKLKEDPTTKYSAKFEWVAGSLIKAIENGEWVILKSANLCNPTVLDRINSLVEANGSITINECGIVDGEHVTVHPHPNFRIFFTVNPKFGEISRAMRNRGVEIFMMGPYWLFDGASQSDIMELKLKDFKCFISQSGVPTLNLVNQMATAHLIALKEGSLKNVDVTFLELARWIQLFMQLLNQGNDLLWSLNTSWKYMYLPCLADAESSRFLLLSNTDAETFDKCVSFFPGGWPKSLKLTDFISYAEESSVKQNFLYLEHLVSQFVMTSWIGGKLGSMLPEECRLQKLISKKMKLPAFTYKIKDDEVKMVKSMLLNAAFWTLEQSGENDIKLYSLRFQRLATQLQKIDSCLSSVLNVMGQELDPIWQGLQMHDRVVMNLIRRFCCQWSYQNSYNYSKDEYKFKAVFQFLENFERNIIIQGNVSNSFIQSYSDLLESHVMFWEAATSLQHGKQIILWHTLVKAIKKLQGYFPEGAQLVLDAAQNNLDDYFFYYLSKPFLWIYGGHPFVPSSAELSKKQQNFMKLCDSIWPSVTDNLSAIDIVASLNPELRSLATQGICMLECMPYKSDNSENMMLEHFDEMCQLLDKRFEYLKLDMDCAFERRGITAEDNEACCSFSPEMFCSEIGFLSWQETAPFDDLKSLCLDTDLLLNLSSTVPSEHNGKSHIPQTFPKLLESAFNYSLSFSTRQPQNFVPHQKLLWALDAWDSIGSVNLKVANYAMEFWFQWHSFLWRQSTFLFKRLRISEDFEFPIANMLLQPIGTLLTIQTLNGKHEVKNHFWKCFKIRAASASLWQCFPSMHNPDHFLIHTLRENFEKIIFAHNKAFEEDKFAKIKSYFIAFKNTGATQEDISRLCSILSTGRHRKLNLCLPTLVQPLLEDLFLPFSYDRFNIGRAWLRIAALRLNLTFMSGNLDPAMKYTHKYNILNDKISSIDLERKVRLECNYFSGFLEDDDFKRSIVVEKLKMECDRLKQKVVYRPDNTSISMLKIGELRKLSLQLYEKAMQLSSNIETFGINQYRCQICNMQDNTQGVITQLSDDFKDYIDIVQPLQVALYEMKLGLSVVATASLQGSFINSIEMEGINCDRVMDSIYWFMKFPRGHASRLIFSTPMDISDSFWQEKFDTLERLVSTSLASQKVAPKLELHRKASLLYSFISRVAHFVADSEGFDVPSFDMLNKLFGEVAASWMEQVILQNEEKQDFQQFMFKPRVFDISDSLDSSVLAFERSFIDDTLSDLNETFIEENIVDKDEVVECKENSDKWCMVDDAFSNGLVDIHNSLFGTTNLVSTLEACTVSNADRLVSFNGSYAIGTDLIKGPMATFSSRLDSQLMAEHLLRLSLNYDQSSTICRNPGKINFYEEPNDPVLSQIVKPITALQQRLSSLLETNEDHPCLLKLKDIAEMLLKLPVNSPLAKALSGLQILINKIKVLQEEGSKFSFSDLLEPLHALVCQWKRMEFESWSSLLDEVEYRHSSSAAKLWFPLFSVVHPSNTSLNEDYHSSVAEGLIEFVHSSSMGEFSKRLKLLFAFHGHFETSRYFKINYSSSQEKISRMLYNVFGYYVQILPRVEGYLLFHRKIAEKEITEVAKLCRWERLETCLSIENSRTTRQKIKKIIQKYNEALQQPVLRIISQEIVLSNMDHVVLQGMKNSDEILNDRICLMTANLIQLFINDERSKSGQTWRRSAVDSIKTSERYLELPDVLEVMISKQRKQASLFRTIEKISRAAVDCNELWNDTAKTVGKKRSFSEFLKLLENSGLLKNNYGSLEVSNILCSLFAQPSHDARHILLRDSGKTIEAKIEQAFDDDWKMVNQFYFQSAASLHALHQICLKAHRDISFDQAKKGLSFVYHLFNILQNQRVFIYSFASNLNSLKKSVGILDIMLVEGSDGESNFRPVSNKQASIECMRKQKLIFDTLVSMMVETSILLNKVGNVHLNSCDKVKKSANDLLQLLEKCIPAMQKTKESINNYQVDQSLSEDFPCHVKVFPTRSFVVSENINFQLNKNFKVIDDFKKQLSELKCQFLDTPFLADVVSELFDLLAKSNSLAEEYNNTLLPRGPPVGTPTSSFNSEADSEHANEFNSALRSTCDLALNAIRGQCFTGIINEDESGSITMWESLIKTPMESLKLNDINKSVLSTISCAERQMNSCGADNSSVLSFIGVSLKHLCCLLRTVLIISEGFHKEFFELHKSVTMTTNLLANVFASLFLKGFQIPSKEDGDDDRDCPPQEASGTGLGEGDGRQDISEQITDEEQLNGSSQQRDEKQDKSNPDNNDNSKGIEMSEDFLGDTFSVSEDSEADDNNDEEEVSLDKEMGETGENKEIVDEKICEGEEDSKMGEENHDDGSTAKDTDNCPKEIRGKGEENAANDMEEPNPLNEEKVDDNEDCKGEESIEEAFPEPNDSKINEIDEKAEDMEIDENKDTTLDDSNMEEHASDVEEQNTESCGDEIQEDAPEETQHSEIIDEDCSEQVDASKEQTCEDNVKNEDASENYQMDSSVSSLINNKEASSEVPNSNDNSNNAAPLTRLPENDSNTAEISVADSSNGEKQTENAAKSELTENKTPSKPNPFRNAGDALKEWKEKAKVTDDTQPENREEITEADDVTEYAFVSNLDEGTDQAMGAATQEQAKTSIPNHLSEEEEHNKDPNDDTSKDDPSYQEEILPTASKPFRNPSNDPQNPESDASPQREVPLDDFLAHDYHTTENYVKITKLMPESISRLTIDDSDLGIPSNQKSAINLTEGAVSLWQKYQLRTARLSQELAEQMRLVIEPNLASKLQGDYRTGKRIKMKKVIAYIASQYRKDKIWERRTRPNKRDYQVVVAIDDSRSMAETKCGEFAVEALLTVCNSMSQLEMGNMAISSFGKKGNIQLLHDFDQPFTREAAIKIISSLTFSQENSINDEPVADLLKYLNNTLDVSVAKARLPSGHNPLQQLVLIIADGRFHEKERLKRYVRDFMSQKRMVAFLVLDSPHESIMDHMEATFVGEGVKFTKYMDSFPFPYYAVLKNIDSLPRTLGDLLRQWLELMQSSRE